MDYGIYGILIGIIVIALGAMLGSMLVRRNFYQKIDDLDMRKPVSYTHLTLPTTPYV